MRGADLLVEQLLCCGVDTVFTIPGIQIMSLFDAIAKRADRIRLVHCRHEQGAAYMAYGYAQATGRPAAVALVPGPGVLNALSGIATAFAANVPMIVISGQIPRAAIGRRQGHLHEIDDQLDVVRPVTKWQGRVLEARELPAMAREAYVQAVSGRQGPVHLEMPPETLTDDANADVIAPVVPAPPRGSDDAIAAAAALLRDARQPAIVVGGGVQRALAGSALREVADALRAPILLTQNAKGVVPESDPDVIGVTYFAGLGPAYELLPRCDVVLAIGTRLFIRGFAFSAEQKLISVNIDPSEHAKNHRPTIAIDADARAFLSALAPHVTGTAGRDRLDPAAFRRGFQHQVRELAPEAVPIIEVLRERFADDAIVVSGMNAVGYWSHLAFQVRTPRTYITPGFFGTLGYAFPTSLGAAVGRPGKQVVSINGDGGFLFCEHELATAVHYGLEVLVIVFNNNAYGASMWDQDELYGGRRLGTALTNPDFVKLANAFGVDAFRCTPAELGATLDRASQVRGAPVLVEVVVPNMLPPFRVNAR